MSNNLKLYRIKQDYLNFLNGYDQKVSHDPTGRRVFIGIVLEINDVKYYAPLSSPKPKHIGMRPGKDMYKINHGAYGVINLNNMIPVCDAALLFYDIKTETNEKYKNIVRNQVIHITRDQEIIRAKATELRELANQHPDAYILKRCCDFVKLETVVELYKTT